MSFILSLLFYTLSCVNYQVVKSFVSPIFITPFVWGSLLLIFNLLPHNLYDLQFQFLSAITLWVFCFSIGGLMVNFVLERLTLRYEVIPSKNIVGIYFWITLLCAPIVIYILVTQALASGPEFFFLSLRGINTGIEESETSLGVLAYIFNFSYVVLLLKIQSYDGSQKNEKVKLIVLIFLNVILSIVTVSRSSFIFLILAVYIILYFKNVIRVKHYFYGIILILGIMIFVTFLRDIASSELGNESSFGETLAIYICGGMPAFDTLKVAIDSDFGANTFRFFYSLFNALGARFDVQPTILEYTNVPILTNVYTVLYPFYKDFGIFGVGLFGCFNGLFLQGFFKLGKRNVKVAQVVYSYLFPMILMNFMGEFLFSNLSTFLQILIFSSIPFYFKIKL